MMRPHHWTVSGVVLALFGMDHSPSLSLLGKCRCRRCRFQKPPREVTIYGATGTIVHLAGASGTVYGTVVLTHIEVWGKGGVSVEFRDRAQHRAEHTIECNHQIGCARGLHTVAEGCWPR